MKIISAINGAIGASAFAPSELSDNVQEVTPRNVVKVAQGHTGAVSDRPRLLERRQVRFNRRTAH